MLIYLQEAAMVVSLTAKWLVLRGYTNLRTSISCRDAGGWLTVQLVRENDDGKVVEVLFSLRLVIRSFVCVFAEWIQWQKLWKKSSRRLYRRAALQSEFTRLQSHSMCKYKIVTFMLIVHVCMDRLAGYIQCFAFLNKNKHMYLFLSFSS